VGESLTERPKLAIMRSSSPPEADPLPAETPESIHRLREEVKSLAGIITGSIRTLKERGVGKEAK
jgi:hypothetical protein